MDRAFMRTVDQIEEQKSSAQQGGKGSWKREYKKTGFQASGALKEKKSWGESLSRWQLQEGKGGFQSGDRPLGQVVKENE